MSTPRSRSLALVGGVSLVLASSASWAAQFGSPAWFATQQSNKVVSVQPLPNGQVGNPTSGRVVSPELALVRAQRSVRNLSRAAEMIAGAQAQQKAARQLALNAPSTVPNGLQVDGLEVAAGVSTDSSLWQNAELPTQSTSGNQTIVTVEQTGSKAILTWDSFNVGRDTTLHFDQSAGKQSDGGNAWIALNRVTDTQARPSQILGTIKAEGSVYVINRSGVVFGGASQVNTHSLLVSSLSLFSDDVAVSNETFLKSGINGLTSITNFALGGQLNFSSQEAIDNWQRPGDIEIQAGAQIATGPNGYSLIAAPNVRNAGTILADQGQAILAAGLGVRLQAFEQESALARVNGWKPVIAGGVSLNFLPTPLGLGSVENTGLIGASRGNVSLVGYEVQQSGVVQATTSISRRGSIYIAAQDSRSNADLLALPGGILTFGSNSLTTILPEQDGETTTSGPTPTINFVAPAAVLAGTQVTLQDAAMVLAPGATVDLLGWAQWSANPDKLTERIDIGRNAVVDVAGLADVQLAMSANQVTIPRVGQNELADSPLQRGDLLFGEEVTVDGRVSGVRGDGLQWFGSPLLNIGGYIQNQPRKLNELLTDGGTIDIIGRELVTHEGSLLNLDGGYIHYLAGRVETLRLLGKDGQLYDISQADPNMSYSGIAGQHRREYSRWNVRQTYNDPLLSGRFGHYETSYIAGGHGGTLNLVMSGATLLGGDISAQAQSGRYQIDAGKPAEGGRFNFGMNAALAGRSFDRNVPLPVGTHISLTHDGPMFPDDFGMDDLVGALPGDPATWTTLSASQLSGAGFSHVALGSANRALEVQEGATLQVENGGSISLRGARVEVYGDLIARSGDISVSATGQWDGDAIPLDPETGLVARGDVIIGGEARLDARGEWVNDGFLGIDERTGRAHIDGGNITLTTHQWQVATADGARDWSGSLTLESGALLDVSSGGYVSSSGQLAMNGAVPLGKGGNIGLLTYVRQNIGFTPPAQQFVGQYAPANDSVGRLDIDGAQLLGHSLGGGGTLQLRALNMQIGGDAPADSRTLHLATGFFANRGFGAYDLAAELDATVVAGTQLRISQDNLLANVETLERMATDPHLDLFGGGFGELGQLDDYHRPATNFSLRAGDFVGRVAGNPAPHLAGATGTLLLDEGASLLLDAGASVRLGSRNQLTVLGGIIAHGGDITLSADSALDFGEAPPPTADQLPGAHFSNSRSVWLGANAVLDVSGVSLIDSLAAPVSTPEGTRTPRTGRVLDGGKVTLTNDTGYVVVEAGARIDLSGAADRYDILRAGDVGTTLVSQDVWSDAGTLTLAAGAGLFFDGSIHAEAGAADAAGGTLVLRSITGPASTGKGILFYQDGSRLAAGLAPGEVVEGDLAQPSGMLYFAAERLRDSGVETLIAGSNPDRVGDYTPLPIGFAGDVTLSLDRAIQLNASSYVALAENARNFADAGGEGGAVHLDARYVSISGNRHAESGNHTLPTDLPIPGAASFSVDAELIDLGGQFSLANFGQANFTSTGDIRFYTPAKYAYRATTPTPFTGQLLTAGDINFTAAQIYPTTDNAFAVVAVGGVDAGTGLARETTITIAGNGRSGDVPLSAGGTLLLDATHIEQQGTVRAPAGRIVLGVADPNDAATRALFGNLPLVATESVHLAPGSLTSVSLEGRRVPWGVTVDATDWQNHANPLLTSYANLAAPPQKQISISGTNVALDDAATIDLKGGGELYAQEWIAGAGGSRDLLSSVNTVYSGNTRSDVPLYADGRPVYAIVPGDQSIAAPYDPAFDTGDVHIGQSVYLSGMDGVPAGVYTLMPVKYATLPGAYRVVQDTGALDIPTSQNARLPDGTLRMSGHFVDGLSGAHESRSTAFLVQSNEVWGQYSEYTTTSADSFFAKLATKTGSAAPQLSRDAGRLTLSATRSLSLDATLATAAGKGGAGAQVDIASERIQIIGSNTAGLDGYLLVDASDLNSLGAASLLVGGVRDQSASGVTIDARTGSLIVANDANSALSAPEILLVTSGGSGAEGDGLQLQSGSVVRAQGEIPASSSVPISIGRNADAANGVAGVSGDGALVRVSNGAPVLINRHNVTGSGGLLEIAAGATLDGGASLSLDATGDTHLNPTAVLTARAIDANSTQVSFVSNAADGAGRSGLVIGPQTLAQLGNTERITLRSRGDIDFVGAIDVDLDDAALSLSASNFVGDGSNVSLSALSLTLSNELNGAASTDPISSGGGALHLDAGTLRFGAGTAKFVGFENVEASATQMITGSGTGSADFGAATLTLSAPLLVGGNLSETTLQTTGGMHLIARSGTIPNNLPTGGALKLIGGSIDGNAQLTARAGQIELRATQGDVTLDAGTTIDVSGIGKKFFDITEYAAGGAIRLTADRGNVNLNQGATLNFAGASGGGDAGSLSVSATQGSARLDGDLLGDAADGRIGGAFSLDTGSAVELDGLADRLFASGIDGAIAVQTRSGDLELTAGHTLKANRVKLVADGGVGGSASNEGHVIVAGTIDASGAKGGDISLYGQSGVDVQGTLRATASQKDKNGGTVRLFTSGVTDGAYNVDYGYQNVTREGSGSITLGDSAVIDVSGVGGAVDGVVQIRAPLLNDGDVNVSIADGTTISGASELGLEAYAVWSTTDATTGSQHFDGIVDPAGWYDSLGKLLPGSFTDKDGKPLGGSGDLSRDIFTPDAPNADHVGFYQQTLADFVQGPGFAFEDRFANRDNFVARAGVEMRNPSPDINGGKISVLTNWNLGATDADGNYYYRYNSAAPVLTLRGVSSVEVKASITDGFKQYANPFGSVTVPGGSTLPVVTVGYASALDIWASWGVSMAAPVALPARFDSGDADQIGIYYGYYQAYVDYLNNLQDAFGDSPISTLGLAQFMVENYGYQDQPGQPQPPALPASPIDYPNYLRDYQQYLAGLFDIWLTTTGGDGPFPTFSAPLPPQAILFDPAQYVPSENLIAPMPTLDNPIPLHTGNIIAGESTSYRVIAGADLSSVDPSALRAADQLTGSADVTIDGHFSFTEDQNGNVVNLPTLLRTGTGDITVAASGDIRLDDPAAPGVIYSAGRLREGDNVGGSVGFVHGFSGANTEYSAALLSSGSATPVDGGNVDLSAGRDILGNRQIYDVDGSVTGIAGSYIGQYWWQWMQTANAEDASFINFGAFGQGVMSIGGDVNIWAGRDIRELSVSLPTTYTLTPDPNGAQLLTVFGGGDLSVYAGRDILSGDYFVSKGEGALSAGGRIGSNFNLTAQTTGAPVSTPVATILGLQDASWQVSAAQGVELGGIYNPSYMRPISGFMEVADSQAYSADSSVSIRSVAGNIALSTMTMPGALFGYGSSVDSSGVPQLDRAIFEDVLPASLDAVALNGSLSMEAGGLMFPSASGNLNLIASQDVRLFARRAGSTVDNSRLTMADVDALLRLPSPINRFDSDFGSNPLLQMSPTRYEMMNLHRADLTPVRLYALSGDIVSGFAGNLGATINALTLRLPKPAVIQAGRDIADLDLRVQNYRNSDVTRVEAGRDIYYTSPGNAVDRQLRRMQIAGPGTLDVSAGRNLGPLSSEPREDTGIRSVGNVDNAGLQYEGADISLRFGVGPGMDIAAFAAHYLDPAQREPGLPDYNERLIAYMRTYLADHSDAAPNGAPLTADTAWTAFQQLPEYQRRLLVQEVFLDLLKRVGADYHDSESAYFQQYARGYEAINILFPADLGYTANSQDGGNNGAEVPIETGNLDMRGSTIQTQRGGDISILGPGGQLIVGSTSAPPVVVDNNGNVLVGPSEQGILTMERGSIGVFSDRSVLLAQSRVFTQRGGDIVMWSSNGDINAGKGAKTSSEKPPVVFDCDLDRYCRVDASGQVTGAGIATLQTAPDAEPGDAILVAPRGTVDAGDAGIRVSGNLVIAAFSIANADNIQVQGASVGVPTGAVNVGTLNSAAGAAAAAQKSAEDLAAQRPPERAASMISVEVIGFGQPSEEQKKKLREEEARRRR